MSVQVRPERPADEDAIRAVHLDAFKGPSESRIPYLLRNDSSAYIPELSLVAEQEGQIVGHVVLSRATLGGQPCNLLVVLGPIGVVKPLQKQGIGAALMDASIEVARRMGFAGIGLIGHRPTILALASSPPPGIGCAPNTTYLTTWQWCSNSRPAA